VGIERFSGLVLGCTLLVTVRSVTPDSVGVASVAGARLREDGKYVTLMERDGSGRWRYVWSIFNRDGPARRLDH
jgi:hypothetical protein